MVTNEEKMNRLKGTLTDLQVLEKENIQYVLTRFWRGSKIKPDDLDILVKHKDFPTVIKMLIDKGYKSLSHDQALGGRIMGMQRNLVKDSRIKIDLHQDFTWKKSHYFDLDLIWDNLEKNKVNGISCLMPSIGVDVFVIIINIIFEKTYITKNDFSHINKSFPRVFETTTFDEQAKKYGWLNTYRLFKKWYKKNGRHKKFPIFLPVSIVIFSYLEKIFRDKRIDLISFLYYIFFRTRFIINKTLPYE